MTSPMVEQLVNEVREALLAEVRKEARKEVKRLLPSVVAAPNGPYGRVTGFAEDGRPLVRLDGDGADVPYDLVDSSIAADLADGDLVQLHYVGSGTLMIAHRPQAT